MISMSLVLLVGYLQVKRLSSCLVWSLTATTPSHSILHPSIAVYDQDDHGLAVGPKYQF
jgi:hypothetical protein